MSKYKNYRHHLEREGGTEREREEEENKSIYIRKPTKKENVEVNVSINTDENEISI